MATQQPAPLPASAAECRRLGWDQVDIILVTGDAYVDHPSFGVALIGRLLQDLGYRVAILAQPRFNSPEDFRQFGPPRLFFGITAGNLDSIVANYSGNGKVRDTDAYSPHGSPWRSNIQSKENRYRPDRATLIYANLARAAYKDTAIVLGGVEASLRRFIHYDYKQERLRGSMLTDAKADILLYGMAEGAITEVARRLQQGESLYGIPGSCLRLTDRELQHHFPDAPHHEAITLLPSWQDIHHTTARFLDAEQTIDTHARALSPSLLLQGQQSGWVLQFPAPPPLTSREMDHIYGLPFTRKPHPATPDIPAYRMIRHSITIVRGCSGNCSFCAIARHQGAVISSRSSDSIVHEASVISKMDDFSGTISDLGGPTANLYKTHCNRSTCTRHDCLFPKVCPHLRIDEDAFLDLLTRVSAIRGVDHLFISSGLRMGLLLKTPRLLQQIITDHTPGSLKIAPEHTEKEVLNLMHKEEHQLLKDFVQECRRLAARMNKKVHFTPYIITAHPGCTVQHNRAMQAKLHQLGLQVRQPQDFTPTPGTLSTAMYVTELHCDKKTPIFVAKKRSDRMAQRQAIERKAPAKKMTRPQQTTPQGPSKPHKRKRRRKK